MSRATSSLTSSALLGPNANAATPKAPQVKAPGVTIGAPHEVTGTLLAISGVQLTLRTRMGKLARVDDSNAIRHERSAVLVVGKLSLPGERTMQAAFFMPL